MEVPVNENDGLDLLLRLAEREGSLAPDRLHAFATALRERARLILKERVEALELRLATVEKENQWRAKIVAEKEKEIAWRVDAMKGLEKSAAELKKENAWQAETISELEKERAWRVDSIQGLEKTVAELKKESAWRAATIAELEKEKVSRSNP
jgi:uncharacterized coiled-coil protein SlyX